MVVVVALVVVTGRVVVVVGWRLSVVVVVGGRLGRGFFTMGRWVLTPSETSACHLTRVPGAGDWVTTTTHLPVELPGPWVVKNSWARRISANVWARVRPTRRGTRRTPWGAFIDTVKVASKCHATIVPGAGDWATTLTHVAFALPGPRVRK